MAFYIKIQPSSMVRFVEGRTQGFRLKAAVVEAVDVTSDIFVYQIKSQPGFTGKDFHFVNIASPSDIEEYPAGIPDDLNDPDIEPFFRTDNIDLVFRSAQAVDEALEKIDQDVESLIEALNLMEELQALQVIEHGTAPSPSSSSSSDSSSSSGP